MNLFQKLFPKGMTRNEVLARLKMLTHKLNKIATSYDNKSLTFRKKAEQLYRQGRRPQSKLMLARSKGFEKKALKFTNLMIKMDHYSSLVQEADLGSEISQAFGIVADQLEKDSEVINPQKAIEQEDRIKTSQIKLEESMDLYGGDIELDFDLDLDEEFAEFEAELNLKDAGHLPEPKMDEPINLLDEEEDLGEISSKEDLQKKVEELEKDLGF